MRVGVGCRVFRVDVHPFFVQGVVNFSSPFLFC